MTIEIRQSSQQRSSRTWAWSVWLEGPQENLDEIEYVIYQLHSTFKNPIRRVRDRETGFRLDGSGWGQFMIYLTLRYRNGREENRRHWLHFDDNAPSKQFEDLLGKEFGGRQPRVFLSYSVADTLTADAIRRDLEQKGVSVLDANSGNLGQSLSDGIEHLIDQADFGISIESDVGSKWAEQEVRRMQQNSLPVLIVTPENPSDLSTANLKIRPLDGGSGAGLASLINPSIKLDQS